MGAAEIFLNKEIAEFTARHSCSQLAPVVVLVLEEFWVCCHDPIVLVIGVASISRTGAKLGSDREGKAISKSTEATSPLL
jgi:hypothetical protein